jgi:pyruvate-formate lyase-activating enzyme
MPPRPSHPPLLVVADEDGALREHPDLHAVGVAGPAPERPDPASWIPVPRGSDLFLLPGRLPVAWEPGAGELVVVDEGGLVAASVFLAPAWTRAHLPAYETQPDAPVLPLHAHALVGWADDTFWTTAVRVDPDVRQDPWTFEDEASIRRGVFAALERSPENRIFQQLSRCALEYGCRAAQNFALGRHEAPLPTSVACNAQCVGCLSLQPDGAFRAAHDRLTRQVRAAEIVEVAAAHWERVPDGVVSFGQGCEGEPLLEADVLVEAVRGMRALGPRGTINLNTNASRPDAVAALADAGLDAIRISLNSARPAVYDAYYRPRGYSFDDVERSAREMKRRGRWVSLNLLYFPGVTDTEAELEALGAFVARAEIDVVQMRNLNVDPEVYVEALPAGAVAPGVGPAEVMRRLRALRPRLSFAYFNPTRARYAELAR